MLKRKMANVQDRIDKHEQNIQSIQNQRFKTLNKKYKNEIKTVLNRQNRGNKKGPLHKYDFDTQKWVLFVLDSGNFRTHHDRKIANRIIEKQSMNGMKNSLELILSITDLKLYIESTYKTHGDLEATKKIYREYDGDIWSDMEASGKMFKNRIKSAMTISAYYDNRNPNTKQGKLLKKLNAKRSLQLITCEKKGKTAVRFIHLNHWYAVNNIPNVNAGYHLYCIKKNLCSQLLAIHLDAASTKKYGDHASTAGWNANISLDLKKNFDLKISGKDKSSEFGESTFFIKPIAIGYSKGSVTNSGVFKMASEEFLQFCVTGANIETKADCFDMANSIEMTAVGGAQEDFLNDLLFVPQRDDLSMFDLELKKAFLMFKHRANLISLLW